MESSLAHSFLHNFFFRQCENVKAFFQDGASSSMFADSCGATQLKEGPEKDDEDDEDEEDDDDDEVLPQRADEAVKSHHLHLHH
ncbi:hypothetical protein JOB18_018265 [Solea senegalensis]|uniref:Uncharacterized protein n=1 Tax=Solea senegalensis TaxID=28829 RepID=A0AAV6PMT0_SOLSE|nr:hypothetical protein JOB18_018265 [Solea senegalensis]